METNNVTPEDWEEKLIHYSMGAMDPQDSARFEAALEQCRSRVQLASIYGQVVGLVASAASPVEPPPGHKARLMARVSATAQVPPETPAERPALTLVTPSTTQGQIAESERGPTPTRAWFWTSAVAAVLILGLMVWLVSTLGTVRSQNDRIAEAEQQIQTLQEQPNIPPGFQTVALAPTEEYTGVSAVVIFNPNSNEAWLVADGLEPLPEDLIYELWLIRPEGQGTSEVGGVFPATQDGTARFRTEATAPISDYAGFAISIERKPGVQEREGPVVVVGRVQEE